MGALGSVGDRHEATTAPRVAAEAGGVFDGAGASGTGGCAAAGTVGAKSKRRRWVRATDRSKQRTT
jgi:hypothetical protein